MVNNEEIKKDDAIDKEVEDLKTSDCDATDEVVEDKEVESEATEAKAEDAKKEDKKQAKKAKKDEIQKLNEELAKLQNANAKIKEDYLRALADMENTKRRLNEDVLKQKKYASYNLVESLVTPVEMLERVTNMETDNAELKNFLQGFKMISKQIVDILEADGLKEIEALGKEFDPNFHHAIEKEHKDGIEANIVLEVKQTGYTYKDRLIRPAMVKVSE